MNAQSPLPEIPEHIHCVLAQSPFAEAETECLATARELNQVLEQEADILKRFAKDELLKLIPGKEFLINELGQKLQGLKNTGGEVLSISQPLKDLLEKISRLNGSNRVFIQRSLAHWQDFLSVLIPSRYRPPGGNPGSYPAIPRGLSFSREV